jgi:hypothetical protein
MNHQLSTNEINNLNNYIKDQSFLDMSIRRGEQFSRFHPKFGNIKIKEEVEVIQKNEIITIKIKNPVEVFKIKKEFKCVSV